MPDVPSHELAKGINESQDVARPPYETLHETLVEEISHDLVCSIGYDHVYMHRDFCLFRRPPSDLYVVFPYLVFDGSAGFICADCEGVSICQICAKIEACRRGDPPVPKDCEAVLTI